MRIKENDIAVGVLRVLKCALIAVAAILDPTWARAQTGGVVGGRVTEMDGAGIQNAIVEMEGQDPILTSAGGFFQFEDVAPGEYVLRVAAFGYISVTRTVVGDGIVTLMIPMEIAPFILDPLVVAPREVDVKGIVRDAARDVSLPAADILINREQVTRTNIRGRFDSDVWEGHPILLGIRAFGYLPLDTLLVPTEDGERHVFNLAVDPLVESMIETEVTRLEERSHIRRTISMRSLNREDLLRWKNATLIDAIRLEYPRRGRAQCLIFDERIVWDGLVVNMLETTLARDVERIEFLFGGAMIRVYTREFMRTMLGGGLELATPAYSSMAKPPLCR